MVYLQRVGTDISRFTYDELGEDFVVSSPSEPYHTDLSSPRRVCSRGGVLPSWPRRSGLNLAGSSNFRLQPSVHP